MLMRSGGPGCPRLRQRTHNVPRRLPALPQDGGDDLSIRGPAASVGRWAIRLHGLMQRRQRVVGYHRVHVVLEMIVHVQVEKAEQRVHVNGPTVESMIEHVLGETRVLRQPKKEQKGPPYRVGRPTSIAGSTECVRMQVNTTATRIMSHARATHEIFQSSAVGMKVRSSAVRPPAACRYSFSSDAAVLLSANTFSARSTSFGGRGTAISGSRPTMSVSVWCRL